MYCSPFIVDPLMFIRKVLKRLLYKITLNRQGVNPPMWIIEELLFALYIAFIIFMTVEKSVPKGYNESIKF